MFGVGAIPWSPLARGMLGRPYAVTAQPGLPVSGIMKVYKHNGLICKKGERFRFKTGWKQLDDEYKGLYFRRPGFG